MKIKKIVINNLRNHKSTELEFEKDLIAFYGKNGAGKTTILEAIALCSFTKSFVAISDSSLISNGENQYNVSLEAVNDLGLPYKISIFYEKGKKKLIKSTFGDNLLPKDIIGELPVVILSPDYKNITYGSPESRRQFVDRLLSQASKIYIDELINFRKALKQRNRLLNQAKLEKTFNYDLLEPWTDILIKSSIEIIHRRYKFIEEFVLQFKKYYSDVSFNKEDVNLKYIPNGFKDEINNNLLNKTFIDNKLREIFKNHQQDEFRRGVTLFGPQKDEFKISINNGLAKEFASQGQHKSLLISIKLAEFEFLKEKRRETPIVLFDDIFSELDDERMLSVFNLIIKKSAHSFITMTEVGKIKKIMNNVNDFDFYEVENGQVNLMN